MNMEVYTTVQDIMSTQYVGQNTSLKKGCVLARYNEFEYLPWDNPDNIASQEAEKYARKIKDLTLAISLVIGVPANITNMAVFYKQGLQDRVNLCLFVLAMCDGLFIMTGFCLHAENIYLPFSAQGVPGNEFVANNNIIVIMGSAFVSFMLSAIIACERCYCVLRPLKYQTLLRTRTMAVIIVCICVCVFSLYFIVAYRYWIICMYDPVTGAVEIKLAGGEFYQTHQKFIDNLDSILFGAGFPGGMMIVVITATIITTVKLRQVISWRAETSTSLSPREVALTKMLIGNSVFFIICISPSCIFRVACLFLPEMSSRGRHHNFYFTTLWTLEGFTFINSTYNFVIYYLMGSRYRETLWALFCKRGTKEKGKRY